MKWELVMYCLAAAISLLKFFYTKVKWKKKAIEKGTCAGRACYLRGEGPDPPRGKNAPKNHCQLQLKFLLAETSPQVEDTVRSSYVYDMQLEKSKK